MVYLRIRQREKKEINGRMCIDRTEKIIRIFIHRINEISFYETTTCYCY